MILEVANGNGITYNGNSLSANIATDDPVPIQKTNSGILIPDLTGPDGEPGGTVRDNITIIGEDSYMYTNKDVVEYIFTMCVYKVISRAKPSTYSVDRSSVKTMDDIMAELNHPIKNSYSNMTTYYMMKDNLLQLREQAHSGKDPSWQYAVDDGNRYFGDSIVALFIITECEHNNSRWTYFTNKLSIKCLWSVIPEFVKGQTYTGTDSI